MALALIEHLRSEYEVEVDESVDVLDDFIRRPGGTMKAVRVRPLDGDCAALTFAFTDFPGIVVHAGAIHDLAFPTCGCDACDTTWQTEAAELERHVFAVVGGGYGESIGAGPRPVPGAAGASSSRARERSGARASPAGRRPNVGAMAASVPCRLTLRRCPWRDSNPQPFP